METYIRRASKLVCTAMIVALVAVAFAFCALFAVKAPEAESNSDLGRTYYREELKNSPLAQRLYDLMSDMAKNGNLTDGEYEYDLVANNVVAQSEVAAYASGASPRLAVSLGAARDAFFMDNPDIFYVDIYRLVLTVGMQNGNYYATLGTGKSDNYYISKNISTADAVDVAVQQYEQAVKSVADGAVSAGADVVSQIKYVNNRLADEVEYDYGAYQNEQNNLEYDGLVHTAYGALVNKKALCDGYSTAFKAVMDRLGIPCVLVLGGACPGMSYADAATGTELAAGYLPHAWNAVRVDGLWYGVDVTWNSTGSNNQRYFLVGSDYLDKDHLSDGVISSSDFELKYPVLRVFNYGVNEDNAGFSFKDSGKIGNTTFGYIEDSEHHSLQLGVSYEGKNSLELKDEGKYLAYRYKLTTGWGDWTCHVAFWDWFLEGNGYNKEESEAFWNAMLGDGYTINNVGYTVDRLQFAIFDAEPTEGTTYTVAEIERHLTAASIEYVNDAYMRYIPAPYVKSMTPNATGEIQSLDPIDVSIVYSEQLIKAEGRENDSVNIVVTGTRHDDVDKFVKVENVVWNESENKLSFTFTPSKQYSHNTESYGFTPDILVGKESAKTPGAGYLSFSRKSVVCPKVFNDGRLYMSVFGHPSFVGAEDLSLGDFKDGNGQPVVGNQRSQLMLVVSEPTESETQDMIEQTGLGNDLLASSTYEIDLQICGFVQKVPTGSYMQVGIGFPPGYGPESAGVKFTVYHYTRNADGTIKDSTAIPCVVTEYGIIATVQSFSPFMICAVKSDEVSAERNVYASVSGIGGSLDKTVIKTVNSGESVSYRLTAESGYVLDKVLLNGKDVTASVNGDTLTVEYAQLGADDAIGNSDIIEISFISERVKQSNANKGLEVIEPKYVVTQSDMIVAAAHDPAPTAAKPDNGGNTGVIVAIVVVVVVLAIGAAVVTVLFMRKNKKTATAQSKSASRSKASQSKPASKTNASVRSKTLDRNKKNKK